MESQDGVNKQEYSVATAPAGTNLAVLGTVFSLLTEKQAPRQGCDCSKDIPFWHLVQLHTYK